MGAVRIVILATAAIAAIALALIVRTLLSPKPPAAPVAVAAPAAAPKPMAQVLVAKKDLAIGTRITPSDLGWQAWPVEALNPSFVTDGAAPAAAPEAPGELAKTAAAKAAQATNDLVMGAGPMQQFDGAIVKEVIMAGEPMTQRKVVRGDASGYMAVVLQPGMRAIGVPVTTETAAGGFILPGDRVDVMQSRQSTDGKTYHTETLMRNLRVLAIDQNTEASKDAKSVVGAVATLEVPAGDAEVLARGKAQGEMILALRSYADAGEASGRGGRSQGDQTVRVFRAGAPTEIAVR